ncbi:MAG: MotA/TolQ/ExbB proton channel family protein [Planctomycetes bacterium]|nr:MotA/TolQ/ExbB proton channel family protein [Planctomycetota bacterium]
MSAFFKYFAQGGILMYPLALVSILALAVIVERAIRLRWGRLFDPVLTEAVQTHLESGELDKASERCSSGSALVARVLGAAVKEYSSTDADMETALQESGQRELQVLYSNLSVLSTVSRVAPLMGLLGTVIGMIGAFEVLSKAGVGKEDMAGQIRIALITTATGLIIAIPTVIADAYFRSRIRKIVAHFEEIFIDVVKSSKIAASRREQ